VKDLCVAAVIMRCELGKPDVNLARIDTFARRAAGEGAHIICFPEACLTGYGVQTSAADHADTIPGPLTEAVLRMAQKHGLTILAGLIERGGRGHLHLTHFVASPDGITGIYRKVHLGPPEQALYRAGQELPVFEHHNVTFGIELCYDAHFPELSTRLALKGADVLFIAHASPRGSPKQKYARWSRYLPARAMDNGVFVVACNQTGKNPFGLSFPGVGLIMDPRGRMISKAVGWEEGMILATLKEEVLRDVRHHPMAYYLRHRRPELYCGKAKCEG
jgi:predicted amidohydrolase